MNTRPSFPASTQASSHASSRPARKPEREYERSGCYPENGRPFRIWALLGGLLLVIALLAGVSALLNYLLI